MASPIDPTLAELEFLISLLSNTPKTRNLSATKEKIVMSLERKGFALSKPPELYPSPDDFVLLTDAGREVLTDIGHFYTILAEQP